MNADPKTQDLGVLAAPRENQMGSPAPNRGARHSPTIAGLTIDPVGVYRTMGNWSKPLFRQVLSRAPGGSVLSWGGGEGGGREGGGREGGGGEMQRRKIVVRIL
jgi:hypothetical protein